jgi:hypothetical protein
MNAIAAGKVHENVAINQRAPHGAGFAAIVGLKYLHAFYPRLGPNGSSCFRRLFRFARVKIRNAAPEFTGDRSLGAVDFDNEVIGTCKSDKLGGISVQLLYHEKIRHLVFRFFENKAADRNMIDRRLRHGGPGRWGNVRCEGASASVRSCNETRSLSLMPRTTYPQHRSFHRPQVTLIS